MTNYFYKVAMNLIIIIKDFISAFYIEKKDMTTAVLAF